MSNISSELCQEAAQIATSFQLRLLISFKFIISALGCFIVCFYYSKKRSSWIPSPNAKVLYRAHISMAILVNFIFSIVFLFEVLRPFIGDKNPCSYVMLARFACGFRILPVLFLHAQSFNMLSFSIERAISTLFHQEYEKTSSSYFGLLLVTTSIILSFALNYFTVIAPIPDGVYATALSAKNKYNMATYPLATFIPLGVEITTIFIFISIYLVNMKLGKCLERRQPNLNHKYQISENKKIIGALLPCFLVHFAFNTFTYAGISLYPMFYPEFDAISTKVWTESFSQSMWYSTVMPLILLYKVRRRKISTFDPTAATGIYFQQLALQFK